MKIHYLLISLFLFSLFSCESDDFTLSERTIIVDSEKAMMIEANSARELPYFRIKYKENEEKPENWFYVLNITNFEYEEGYIYEIKIEEKKIKNPIQDQPEKNYKFLQLVSKTKVTEMPE